jgi:hypothetical protein
MGARPNVGGNFRSFGSPNARSFGSAGAGGFNRAGALAGANRSPATGMNRSFGNTNAGFAGLNRAGALGGVNRSFGNANAGFGGINRASALGGVNRSFGNAGVGNISRATALGAGNRFGNVNNINRTSVVNQTSFNRFNNGGFGNGGFGGFGGGRSGFGGGSPYMGYHRGWYGGYGGYGRGYGGYGGYGYGRYGFGYPGFGYGFGYPFLSGLGFGLGYGLGFGLFGYPWFGYGFGGGLGYGGYGGYGYGGYGYGGYGYGGYGLSNWLYGSSLYDWGYSPYYNPYYGGYGGYGLGTTTVVTVPYDYSQPINTVAPLPAQSVTDDGMALFASARESFKQGNYDIALQQANDALTKLPNDSALHEFRTLCLFAQGRYDDAATALYAVLSVGPGWDWPTMVGLYSNADVYTSQLRALENWCNANRESAAARFVLAYHYLTQGHNDAAVSILRQVVALRPNDTLSAKLLRQLESAQSNSGVVSGPPVPVTTGVAALAEPVPAPAPAPGAAAGPALEPATATAMPEGASISGTWSAKPSPDVSITLTIQPGGAFTWQVANKGQTQHFSGTSSFGGGVLTLAQDKGSVMVGRVSWKDPNHITFRVIGGGPEDPGLSFSK